MERLFAEVKERCVRLGSHCSIAALEREMLSYLKNCYKKPKPFIWTADADVILGKVKRLFERISKSGLSQTSALVVYAV